jgi:hypothetical protein
LNRPESFAGAQTLLPCPALQQVLQIVHQGHEVDWAEVALSCGCFDQVHFIHDFKEFSGINSTAYLAARTEHLNHVPIRD